MPEHVPPELWVPRQVLNAPYELPTQEDVRQRFAHRVWNGYDEAAIVRLEDSYSALRWPEQTPTALAFLDIDDFVGDLGVSLRRTMYSEEQDTGYQRHSYHDYGEGMFFADKGQEETVKYPLIRLVKESPVGLQPADHIDAIRSMLHSWRAAGVYVTFITSTIDGAEQAAVDFVGRYFNKACDGMIITKGHYELADKGEAAARVVEFTGAAPGTPVVHGDDLTFNTVKVRTALQTHPLNLQVGSFQRMQASHIPLDTESVHAPSALETFECMNHFLEQKLGRRLWLSPAHFTGGRRAVL